MLENPEARCPIEKGCALDGSGKKGEESGIRLDLDDTHDKSAMKLGWKLFEADQLQQAENLFRSALSDPVPSVRASAAKGLNRTSR